MKYTEKICDCIYIIHVNVPVCSYLILLLNVEERPDWICLDENVFFCLRLHDLALVCLQLL